MGCYFGYDYFCRVLFIRSARKVVPLTWFLLMVIEELSGWSLATFISIIWSPGNREFGLKRGRYPIPSTWSTSSPDNLAIGIIEPLSTHSLYIVAGPMCNPSIYESPTNHRANPAFDIPLRDLYFCTLGVQAAKYRSWEGVFIGDSGGWPLLTHECVPFNDCYCNTAWISINFTRYQKRNLGDLSWRWWNCWLTLSLPAARTSFSAECVQYGVWVIALCLPAVWTSSSSTRQGKTFHTR